MHIMYSFLHTKHNSLHTKHKYMFSMHSSLHTFSEKSVIFKTFSMPKIQACFVHHKCERIFSKLLQTVCNILEKQISVHVFMHNKHISWFSMCSSLSTMHSFLHTYLSKKCSMNLYILCLFINILDMNMFIVCTKLCIVYTKVCILIHFQTVKLVCRKLCIVNKELHILNQEICLLCMKTCTLICFS